jgi:hypothetical protein
VTDLLPGGRADRLRPGDFDRRQLAIGTRHELEHTRDRRLAREIAMDHLAEDRDYYRKLAKMEALPNPAPEITPLGWFVLAGIGVATVALWMTSKKAKAETAKTCAVDVQKLNAWGLKKGVPVLYIATAEQPPSLTALSAMGVTVTELEQDFVVVIKDGSFWTYEGETAVEAPSLRAEYCASP